MQLKHVPRAAQIKLQALNHFSLPGKAGVRGTSAPTGFLSVQMTWLASVLVKMENKLDPNAVLGRSDQEHALGIGCCH